jgi:hypothetical protein
VNVAECLLEFGADTNIQGAPIFLAHMLILRAIWLPVMPASANYGSRLQGNHASRWCPQLSGGVRARGIHICEGRGGRLMGWDGGDLTARSNVAARLSPPCERNTLEVVSPRSTLFGLFGEQII